MRAEVWVPCDDSPWEGALPGEPVWLNAVGQVTLSPHEGRQCGHLSKTGPVCCLVSTTVVLDYPPLLFKVKL